VEFKLFLDQEYSATVVEENGGGNEATIHSKSRGQYRPSFLPLDLGWGGGGGEGWGGGGSIAKQSRKTQQGNMTACRLA
jgi:hypothetical protein